MACHVPPIGEKNDLGPAEHSVAARGLFDFTVRQGIYMFVLLLSRFMWPCYGVLRQNAVLERFGGRSRSHRVKGFYTFEAQKGMFMKHPKMWNKQYETQTRTRRGAAKKMRIRVSCVNSSLFVAQKRSQPPPPRATPVPVRHPTGLM